MSDEGSNGEACQVMLDDSSPSIKIVQGECQNGEVDEKCPIAASDGLETIEERRMRRKSHYIIYVTTFVMSIGFSIVLTGVWPYLKQLDPLASKEFLGWVIAANPLGQMIASPILGLWANRVGTNRGAFFTTIIMFIVGNFLYAFLPLFKHNAKYIMVLSRFIVGVSSANIALCRSYIASSTRVKERTTAISITAAAQSLGFILGPSIQAALAAANPSLPLSSNSSSHNSFHASFTSKNMTVGEGLGDLDQRNSYDFFNIYVMTGWMVAFLGIFNLILFIPGIYKEFPFINTSTSSSDQKNPSATPDIMAICALLLGFFFVLFIFVLIESIMVPLTLDLYAWESEYAIKVVGIAMTLAGLCSLVMFALSSCLAKRFGDRKIFLWLGLLPMVVSMLSFIPMGNTLPKIKYCDHVSSPSPIVNSFFDENISDNGPISPKFEALSVPSTSCRGHGCPSYQEWCFYTPIITLPQLAISTLLATIGYPVALTLSSSIFSKMLGSQPQGIWMGIMTSTGGLSRVVGPIFVTYMYTSLGTRWMFGSLFVILSFTFILNSIFYKRFKPLQEEDIPVSYKVEGNGHAR